MNFLAVSCLFLTICLTHASLPYQNECRSDQFKCVKSNGNCIPQKWTCDDDKDCLNGEDEDPEKCGRQPSPNFPGRQPSPNFPGRQPSPNFPGRQPSPNFPGRQPSPNFPGRQPSPNFPGRQPSPNFPGRQPSPNFPGRQPSLNFPGRQPSLNFPGRQPSSTFPRPIPLLPKFPVQCPYGHFLCDKDCVSDVFRCNGFQDCQSGIDEQDCEISPVRHPHCSRGQVQCYSGRCIHARQICDGRIDCDHYEDEFACELKAFGKHTEFSYKCIEKCLGIQRQNCTPTSPLPPRPTPTTTTIRPRTRFCDSGYDLVFDRCIRASVFPPESWESARQSCIESDSALVRIDTGDFYVHLHTYLNQSQYEAYSFWTCASDSKQEGHWVCPDSYEPIHIGTPLWSIAREGNSYQQEPSGREGENCGVIESCPFRYLNDDYCDRKFPFICQREAKFKYW